MTDVEATVKMILFYSVVTFSIFPNAILVFTVPRTDRDLKIHNILIVSLASSDALRAILGHLPEVATAHGRIVLQDGATNICTVTGFLICFSAYVSVTHMMALPLEQLLHIVYPILWSKLFHSKLIKTLLVLAVWTYGILFAIPPLVGLSSYRIKSGVCSLNWADRTVAGKIYLMSLFVFLYVLPMIAILVSFNLIQRELTSMKISAETLYGETNFRLMKKHKMLKQNNILVLAMITSFFIAWTPYACVAFMVVMDTKTTYTLTWVSAFLGKSTVLINPLLYFFLRSSYRTKLRRMLRRRSAMVVPVVRLFTENMELSYECTDARKTSVTRTWTV